jgi:hypothetical protein
VTGIAAPQGREGHSVFSRSVGVFLYPAVGVAVATAMLRHLGYTIFSRTKPPTTASGSTYHS